MSNITKRDLNKVVFRGIFLQLSWNYERMQALGYCHSILPVLKKLYVNDPEGLKKAVTRNLEFFNTQPYMAMPIMGATIAMEERLAVHKDIDDSSISAIKVALMGPLAGIGDSLFWFTLVPITAGIGVSLAEGGSVLGPLAFLLLYNIFNLATRYFGLTLAYKKGISFVDSLAKSGLMTRITETTTIIGLMVLGVMSATMIKIPLNFVIGEGSKAHTLQSIFDTIMPNILPLLATVMVYKAFKKGMSATKLLLLIILLAIVGAYLGLFPVA